MASNTQTNSKYCTCIRIACIFVSQKAGDEDDKDDYNLDMFFADYLDGYDTASVRRYPSEYAASCVDCRVTSGFGDRQKTQPSSSSFLCKYHNRRFVVDCVSLRSSQNIT